MARQTEVQERVRGSAARKSIQGVRSTQAASAARFDSERATSAARPPIRSAHLRPSIASSTQSIEGVLMVSPAKIASLKAPFEFKRKSFGNGQGGTYPEARATARGLSTSMP